LLVAAGILGVGMKGWEIIGREAESPSPETVSDQPEGDIKGATDDVERPEVPTLV
jgi:hypothetical protein